MSILIVEDNPVNARLLALMLNAQGYQTVVSRNGKEGLTAMAGIPDLQLIITDYMMPEMDGLEFIAKVRALPAFRHLPILVASAHADLETVKRVQGIQCEGFLVKPIDKQQLIKRVENLVRSQPVVMCSKFKTMEKLDIGLEDYYDLLNTFTTQLSAIIPIVVLEQDDSEEPISKNLSRLFKDLAESAVMLGAEKFTRLYSKVMEGGRLLRSHCPALLMVIQELELMLLAYARASTNSVAKTDTALPPLL